MSELRDVADYINKKGLPSKDEMRATVEAHDRAILMNPVYKKLDEYRVLHNRWTAGEELNEEEMQQMTDLSQELEELAKKMQ